MFPETITNTLSPATLKQAASLSASERQMLFLQYVEKAEQIWMRQGPDGFVMIESEQADGVAEFNAILPLWPHQDLVKLWAPQDCAQSVPAEVSLTTFYDTWLTGLQKNNIGLLIFPTDEDTGILMSADELKVSFFEDGVKREK